MPRKIPSTYIILNIKKFIEVRGGIINERKNYNT